MKRLFLLLILLPFLGLSSPGRSLQDLRLSTGWLFITMPSGEFGGCSAVSIAPSHWLTEAHCDKGVIAINGDPSSVEILKEDKNVDLLLLKGPIVPTVEVASEEPSLGEEVTLMGWPHGWAQPKPLIFFGRLQAENEDVGIDGWPAHPMNFFHEGGGPGMSGGPIFNKEGKLVGITEGAAQYPSVSVGSPTVKVIRKFLGLK